MVLQIFYWSVLQIKQYLTLLNVLHDEIKDEIGCFFFSGLGGDRVTSLFQRRPHSPNYSSGTTAYGFPSFFAQWHGGINPGLNVLGILVKGQQYRWIRLPGGHPSGSSDDSGNTLARRYS